MQLEDMTEVKVLITQVKPPERPMYTTLTVVIQILHSKQLNEL